jgi:hypothetical protein
MTDETKPVYTVSGNSCRITRLDTEGNPIGEPIDVAGPVTFDVDADDVADFDLTRDTMTLEFRATDVGPDLMWLLFGGLVPEPEPTRWQRFKVWLLLPYWRRIKRWLR